MPPYTLKQAGLSLLSLEITLLDTIHDYLQGDVFSQRWMEKACGMPVRGIRKLPPPSIDLVAVKKRRDRTSLRRRGYDVHICLQFTSHKNYELAVWKADKGLWMRTPFSKKGWIRTWSFGSIPRSACFCFEWDSEKEQQPRRYEFESLHLNIEGHSGWRRQYQLYQHAALLDTLGEYTEEILTQGLGSPVENPATYIGSFHTCEMTRM